MQDIVLEWLDPSDPRMAQAHALRHEVLFAPFGIPRDDRWDDEGADRLHIAAFRDGELVGYANMLLNPDGTGHVRQVSVLPELQRSGVGRALMEGIEDEARRRGIARLSLNARTTAEGFYARIGWRTVSDVFPFGRTGVPHVRMEKRIG